MPPSHVQRPNSADDKKRSFLTVRWNDGLALAQISGDIVINAHTNVFQDFVFLAEDVTYPKAVWESLIN